MPFKIVVLVVAIYTLMQYAFTRHVAYKLSKYDPDYFRDLSFSGPSMRVSLNITRMIFDAGLPRDSYSSDMKRLILIARVIYAGTIPLFVMLLLM